VLRLGRNGGEYRVGEVDQEDVVAAITGAKDNVWPSAPPAARMSPRRPAPRRTRRWARRVRDERADGRTSRGEPTVVHPEDVEESPAVGAARRFPASERRAAGPARGPGRYVDDFVARLRSGELGSLPVIVGLIVIVIVFEALNSVFLHAFNLVSIAS